MFKSGFIAIVGRPNAGKSTFINQVLKQKIAIMTNKPQTTRNKIQGIKTDSDSQMIFIDTPGIHKPKTELGKWMTKVALSSTKDVDVVYYMVDATQSFGTGDSFILEHLQKVKYPVFLLLNKVDLLKQEQVMNLILEWKDRYDFAEIFPISALKDTNIDRLLSVTKEYLNEGFMYYPETTVTDYPEKFIIAELIREKILLLTEEEVPHSIAVVIDKIKSKNDKLVIDATIIVERDSQKGIIIGKQGSMIKKIGILARADIENLLGSQSYLELFVRVEKDWRNKQRHLSNFGYGKDYE